ncbi:MAG: acetylornithine/succinylornithine family transaminase [Eubacteriales bacterium]
MNVFDIDHAYIAPTYARFPVNIVRGKGSFAYDSDGTEYIDLGSGIAVNTFGYCDEEWVEAVTKQLSLLQHASNLYYTEPCASLAKLLCERTGMKKVFFSNSGAEANECAIKAARKYASDKNGGEYYTIVTLKNSFHGRTLTTLAATGQDVFHEHFTPLTEGFVHCEANAEELCRAVSEHKTAAIMFEIVRGEGGVLPLDAAFVEEMTRLAEEQDILLIADEVQCGNGRCGKLYSYMNYGFTPDIVTTAKGLGGGLPIGATMLGGKVADIFSPGMNGSTFGGNPVACAGALSILNRIDNSLLNEVKKKSDFIFSALKNSKGIENVTGLGLMIGVKTLKDAKQVAYECLERGVLVLTAKDKVRLLPALNIPFDALETALETLKKVCMEEK